MNENGGTHGAGGNATVVSTPTIETGAANNGFEYYNGGMVERSGAESRVSERSVGGSEAANRVLTDVKENGFKDTFKRLSDGDYSRQDKTEKPDTVEGEKGTKPTEEPKIIDLSKAMEERKALKAESDKELPKDVSEDPLYREKLGEAYQEAVDSGKHLDKEQIEKEALEKYSRAKEEEIQKEEENGGEAASLKDQVEQLTEKNNLLSNRVDDLERRLQTNEELMKLMAEMLKMLEEEKDPENKNTLIRTLIRIIATFLASLAGDESRKTSQEVSKDLSKAA